MQSATPGWRRLVPGLSRPSTAGPTRRMPNVVVTRRNMLRSTRPPAHPKTLTLTKSKKNLLASAGISALNRSNRRTRKNNTNKIARQGNSKAGQ